MALLLLKLTLTPLLIGGASLAARRWGPAIGGWIVSLPLTSGPVALYLALDRGPSFAASTARGSLGGLLGDAAFALAYGWLARRYHWPASLLGGLVAFAIAALAISPTLAGPLVLEFGLVGVAMTVLLKLAPPAVQADDPGPLPAWDLPARVVVGTAIVMAITAASGLLGPQLSGVLAALPVYVSVLAVFAHELEGPNQALGVVRGLQVGLFGTIFFFLVVTSTIEQYGIPTALVGGLAAVAVVQAFTLRLLRRPIPPAAGAP